MLSLLGMGSFHRMIGISQDSANQTPLQVAARRGWVEVCCCIAYHVLNSESFPASMIRQLDK